MFKRDETFRWKGIGLASNNTNITQGVNMKKETKLHSQSYKDNLNILQLDRRQW